MREYTRMWAENMYNTELQEINGTIKNEELVMLGDSVENQEMHESNLADLNDYKEYLQNCVLELRNA